MENSFTILFLIYLNSDPSKKIRVLFTRTTSLSSILSKCKEKFQLNSLSKCILYDLRGDQIAEDDLEYLNPQEPLFLSKGEDFSCNTLKALYDKVKSLGKGGFGTVKLYKNKITKFPTKKVAFFYGLLFLHSAFSGAFYPIYGT